MWMSYKNRIFLKYACVFKKAKKYGTFTQYREKKIKICL